MFNYSIMRLSYLHVTGILFVTGVMVGGFGGITLGLLAMDAVGVLGGAFLGLVTGLGCAFLGLVFTAVFNLIAPYTGGLPIRLEAQPSPDSSTTPSPDTNTTQNTSA